ncbi:MAG: hypothetical protein ACRDGD_02495 [Candidatus Limnocylindria bacterium]
MKRTSILLVTLLMLVIAACSSDAGTSPSPSAAEPTPAAEPSDEPTTAPEESEEAVASDDPLGSGFAIPSFDLNGDPELADRFPDTIGGQPIQVLSMGGEAFAGAGDSDPAFDAFLDSVDAEYSDVSVAFGGSADGTVGIFAFRIQGVPEDQLEQEFLSANEAQGEIANVQQETIAGKDVWSASSTDASLPGSAYIYVKDDTVYFLTGTSDQAAEILGALP